jgi:SAM-dependent methyltransferase
MLNTNHNDYNVSFAKYYDLINSEKDYNAESLEFDSKIRKYINIRKPQVADVGCGTGNYTIEFSKLGYEIVGYDVSSSMIEIAKNKYPNISFYNKPFGEENKKYDVVVSLFNVVNSLGDYERLCDFLTSIAQNMLGHAIFLFDMWNGVAVFKFPPQKKTKIITKDKIKIIREVVPHNVDNINQISVMTYNLKVYTNDVLIEGLNPILTSHFFTFNEMVHALHNSGLEIIETFPYGRCNDPITEKDWKINFICKKLSY